MPGRGTDPAIQEEQYYGLDPIGADIVTRLTQGPVEDGVYALCDQYEVDVDLLRADIDRLVGELVKAGLLVRTRSH